MSRVVQRITGKHFPGQYLDIALCRRQYKIYYPAAPFDPPTQDGICFHEFLSNAQS